MARLGRLRAVLRLGERADARSPRRRLLETRSRQGARTRARAGLRHRPHLAAAGSRRRALVGVDRSAPMLARAARRARRSRATSGGSRLSLVRGDIRALPFAPRRFGMVLAPYGMLQSLLRDRDLQATLESVHDVLSPAACSASISCPTCRNGRNTRTGFSCAAAGRPAARTHADRIRPQDPRRRLTIFEQEYLVRAARLRDVANTVSADVPDAVRQQDDPPPRDGRLRVEAVLGDYGAAPGTSAPTCGSSWRAAT